MPTSRASAPSWASAAPRIEPSTIRQEVLGCGWFAKGTVKAVVVRWAQQRGIDTNNDNIADACCGWEFAVRHVVRRELV